MDEYLRKFVNMELALDMEGTDENDWRDLVKDFSRIGFDLDHSAKIWWEQNKPGIPIDETEPFVEYERQNSDGIHLKFPYLILRENHIRSHMSKVGATISYIELKENFEQTPEFTLDF